MKIINLISILLISSTSIFSQDTISVKYYKDIYGYRQVNQKKANYVKKNFIMPDSSECSIIIDLKLDTLISRKCFKSGYETGIWLNSDGTKIKKDSYMKRTVVKCDSLPEYDIKSKRFVDTSIINFEPPVFGNGEIIEFFMYIANNVEYPLIAREMEIQGQVITQCIIDEFGVVKDVSILNSIHKSIDDAATKVLLDSPQWKPAKINNISISFFIVLPVNFILN